MPRPTTYTLLALTLLLALFPLTLQKPGTPPTLKADEAAYVMMAQSLAYDGDLRVEQQDLERIFSQFPYRPVDNLILMTDDGWRTVFYGKPYLYSLAAAPLVRLFGVNGLLCFNMLLMLAMVWMGTVYLRTFNQEWLAALFAAGFFLASAGFVYVFWLQPELFQMASVTASLFLAFHLLPRFHRHWGWLTAALSGAALAPAAYGKPMLIALALPVLAGLVREKRWRAAASWVAGAALGLSLAAGLSVALTGHPSSYLGVERLGVTLCEPDVMPVEPQAPEGRIGPGTDRPTGGAWSWIFRVPTVRPGELLENLGYFLWGRHTGLFLYFPFALLALGLFTLSGEGRTLARWLLLAALAGVALSFILFIDHNWHGGGGFIGNRYFVNAYPAFLFLVTRLRGGKVTLAGYGLASLFLGTLLFSPFGRSAPEPTLQSHVRGWPFQFFPRELSLREIPGYQQVGIGGYSFSGRNDVMLPRGESFWLRGASESEIWITGEQPLARASFLISGIETANRITLRMGDDRQTLDLAPGEARRVELAPGKADRVRTRGDATFHVYRLRVTPELGRAHGWTRHYPPPRCENFAFQPSTEETFYLGATLTFLGTEELTEGDPFRLRWGQIEVPPTMVAGAEVELPVRLFNASEVAWVQAGAARVKLSYHWLHEDGSVAVANGARTELPLPVEAGERVVIRQKILVPTEPGRYVLELDPVFEHVAWFGTHPDAKSYRAEVEVVAPPAGVPETSSAGDPGPHELPEDP